MKKNYTSKVAGKVIVFFLFCIFLFSSKIFAQLNGTYTIGTNGTEDYTSFTDAVTALTTSGISSSVVFNISDGDYNEQITISEITGASEMDTIIFQSASGDTADVKIYFEPTVSGDNYTINFDGADYITFKNLTITSEGASDFGTVITINNNIEHVSFIGNHFKGKTGTEATYRDKCLLRGDLSSVDTCVVFVDNKFDTWRHAMSYDSADSLFIINNTFINGYLSSLSLTQLENSLFENNLFENNSEFHGISISSITGNTPIIMRNNIILGNVTLSWIGASSDNYPMQVYNNFISGRIFVEYSHYASIFNNTIYGDTYSPLIVKSTSGEIKILNNIFYSDNSSNSAIIVEDIVSIDTLDFNNLYSTGSTLVTSNSVDYATLADWQAAVNQSAHSYNVDINFIDEANTDLHIAVGEPDLFGTTFTGISDDIDGESRHETDPNIGADEYSKHPMSGTYTIGKNGTEDYGSFSDAVESLVFNGISGSTSFNVSSGTYHEQISIPEINGASEMDTIVFQSSSGDTADVKIYYEPVGSGDNYTINFDGADYITLKNLTIASEGASDFGTVITINNNIKQVSFIGNHFIGKTGTTSSIYDKANVRGDLGSVDTCIVFNDNKFDTWKFAMRYEYVDSFFLINNTFINGDISYCLDIFYLSNSLLENNTITGKIRLYNLSGNTPVVVRNNILRGYLNLNDVGSASDQYPVQVYNNFVRGGFTVESSNYAEIFNNTVYNNVYYPIQVGSTSSEIKILNNIFYTDNSGYPAILIDDIASIDTLDFNNLYSTGSKLLTSNAVDYATLADWQAAVNQSTNSYNVDVNFVDEANTDLHIAEGNPVLYGTAFTGVMYDIDGELRHSINPNIGADEYVFLSDQNDFLTYSFTEQTGDAIINTENHTISVEVAYGTDLASLVATFTISENATVAIGIDEQVSGVTTNDFSSPVTYAITAEDASEQNWIVTVSVALNDENDIVSYSFTEQAGAAVINNVEHTIDIEVEFGTDLSNLVSTFTLSAEATAKIGLTDQVSGTTANDFSSPVTYVITAEDGSEQNWIVTVGVALNDENDILSYSFPEQTGTAVINNVAHTVDIEVEFGTDLSNLVSTFTLSAEATAKIGLTDQLSGTTANDFSSPVTYVIIAEDGSEQNWLITVGVALNNENDILSYSLTEQTGSAVINNVEHTVDIEVAFGTDISSLVATFTLSAEATAKIGLTDQVSGVTVNDFGISRTYTIYAENGETQSWIITVTIALNSENDILSYSFTKQTGPAIINNTNHTVDIEVNESADVTALIAYFVISDAATINIGGTSQFSGETVNNFSSPVTYTITAEDDTEQTWTVTVTNALNDENDILTFSFVEQTGEATISATNHTVNIEVEFGTDLTSLIAGFTLSPDAIAQIGITDQVSGTTANDFSSAVIYKVYAENGSTQDWTVSVTVAQNSENDILTFSFPEQNGAATINATDHTVEIELLPGSSLSSLVATFTLSENATANINDVAQVSGTTSNDFSATVMYNVIAEDNSEQIWFVYVTVEPYHGCDILTFSFAEQTGDATINGTNHIIDVEVTEGTDVTHLIATYTLSDGAIVKVDGDFQTSGTSENDFTEGVTYVVVAEDGINETEWTVNVTAQDNSTGIEDLENLEFRIFPNPATNYINIKSNMVQNDLVSLEIIDITGKIKFSKQIYLNNDLNVTLYFDDEITSGIYFLRVKTTKKAITQRFFVK